MLKPSVFHKCGRLTVAGILSAGALWVGCGALEERNQLVTFANLQSAAFSLMELYEEKGHILKTDADMVVERLFEDGRDSWGNPVLFIPGNPPDEFLLISTGRDGQLDIPDPKGYLGRELERVEGRPDRDLVFQGSMPVVVGTSK